MIFTSGYEASRQYIQNNFLSLLFKKFLKSKQNKLAENTLSINQFFQFLRDYSLYHICMYFYMIALSRYVRHVEKDY